VEKWRKKHGQKALDLSTPKIKRETEKKLSEYIAEGVKAGLFNTLKEVENELGILGVNIVNEGYDKGKQFHYLTIENDSGKMRLRGDFYSAEFYKLTREDRRESVSDNKSFGTRDEELRRDGTDAKQALRRERVKRDKFVKKQYGRTRERAYQKKDNLYDRIHGERAGGRILQNGETKQREDDHPKSMDRNQTYRPVKKDIEPEQRSFEHSAATKKSHEKFEFMDGHGFCDSDNRPIAWDSDRVVSTEANGEEWRTNPRGRDAGVKAKLHATQDGRGLAISREAREELLDDSTRAEIEETIRATAGSLHKRAEADYKLLRNEYERSKKCDSGAKQDVGAVWERIKELGNTHQSRTAGRIGESAEREGAELERAVIQTKREQSATSKSYAELERELERAVKGVGEQAREHEQGRRGLSGAVKRCIEKAITKVKEIAQSVEHSYSRSFRMKF
jgi:hypothetical protein